MRLPAAIRLHGILRLSSIISCQPPSSKDAVVYRKPYLNYHNFGYICALMLNERPLAVHWGLSCLQRLYYLMPAFDIEKYPSLSTGNLLLVKLLQYCAGNNYRLVDFANGDEPYKEKWCEMELPLYEGYIPSEPAGWLISLFESALESMKRSTLAPHLKRMAQFLKFSA